MADRQGIYDVTHYREQVEAIADEVVKALKRRNKVLWMGTGGSASKARHLAS
jgi:phosphoheptose isomerase